MDYIGIRSHGLDAGSVVLKADLIVTCVYLACLIRALRYVHIARRSHSKVR